MRIIGVLDLAHGRAVHARAGRRAEYTDVQQVAGKAIPPGDALALAAAYRHQLGIDELYAADLDAIVSARPQHAIAGHLATIAPLWLDAGITSADAATAAITAGAAHVIVGLETLSSFKRLADICSAVGAERVAFSLDLHARQPTHRMNPAPADASPASLVSRAVDAGASAVIILDVARVGTEAGPDFELIGDVRRSIGPVTLLAGGGVRGLDDLSRLGDHGCDGALIATALHDGRLTAGDIATAKRRQPRVSR